MSETNIKFSSVPVTVSLHEAIKGAAELSGKSEEEVIHQTLTSFVWHIIQSSSEIVTLKGESVEDDFNLLKYYWEKQQEGKRVFLRAGGTKRHLRVNQKAMEKYEKWVKNKEHSACRDCDPFESFLTNIKNEQEWRSEVDRIKMEITTLQLSLKLEDPEGYEAKKSQLKELNEELVLKEEEGKKYRKDKGYLQSEIPLDATPFPQCFVTDKISEIIQAVNAGNIPSIDDLMYLALFGKGTYNQIKKGIVKVAGKKRAKKLFKAVTKRIRKRLDDLTNQIDPDA